MDRASVDGFLSEGYDRLMQEGYKSLRQTVAEAIHTPGFDYPPILVNMTELARQYDKEGQTKQAIDVINAALQTFEVFARRYRVPKVS